MIQPGFFGLQDRLHKIDKNDDPLTKINQTVDWEMFRLALEKARDKGRKSSVGPKGYDVILLFKILILQSLYNLSDAVAEFQILDRHCFGRFLGLRISQKVPDAATIWLFREDFIKAGIVEELCAAFDAQLRANGFMAMKGQLVDASIVKVAKQRNSREENARIQEGGIPEDWSENKRRRKDVDACWIKKNGKSFYEYKSHVPVDMKHYLIRSCAATDAALHGGKVFEQVLSADASKDIWADSAYRSAERVERLCADGFREHIHRKGSCNHPLRPREQEDNKTKSRIRWRVEHVFGIQVQRSGHLLLRTVGIRRVWAKIGLRNLAYNIDRMGMLLTAKG